MITPELAQAYVVDALHYTQTTDEPWKSGLETLQLVVVRYGLESLNPPQFWPALSRLEYIDHAVTAGYFVLPDEADPNEYSNWIGPDVPEQYLPKIDPTVPRRRKYQLLLDRADVAVITERLPEPLSDPSQK